MSNHVLRRGVSALGISLAVGVIAFAPATYAQPQQLPGPQYQGPQYPAPQYQAPQYQYSQPQYGQPDQYRNGGQYDRGPRDQRNGANRLDRRLAFLHQRLGITPAQEAAWTEFTGELRNSAMSKGAHETRPEERGSANVVQRLELRERMLETRSAELDRMVRALRPLYASFSDEQKRTADQLLFRAERGRGFAGGPGSRNGRPGGPRAPG
jgi:hypothetical protein